MKRLLAIEFQKAWKNKASRVLTISYFVLLSFLALIASIKFDLFGIQIRIADQGIFNFPYIWHFNSWLADWAKLFLALVVVSMISNEYSYGTLKQNLIDGLSKKEFLQSKFLAIIAFSALSTVFVFALSLILGLCFSSYDEPSIVFSDLEYLLAYFVKHVCFFAFCIFLAILVKRSAFAIGFLFIWWVFEAMLQHMLLPRLFGSTDVAARIVDFLPIESMANLIKEPITKFQAYKAIENQINADAIAKDYSVHWYEISVVVLWTVFFFITSFKLLQKRDL